MRVVILFMMLICMATINPIAAQVIMPLYEKEVPNSRAAPNEEWQEQGADSILRIHAVSVPTITVFLPAREKRTGDAVIIFPGGGYRILAASHEGYDVAREFVSKGIAAFVVKY